MKRFLTGMLAVASVSTTSIAAAAVETLIFAPSPQPCTTLTGCSATPPDSKTQEKITKNIIERYSFINSMSPMGVVINGNMTLSGSSDEINKSNELFNTYLPAVPYFLGLGNNEYYGDNKNRAIEWLNYHVAGYMRDKLKMDPQPSFDFRLPTNGTSANGGGSLGYALELGKDRQFYFIQINDTNAIKDGVVSGKVLGYNATVQTYSVAGWLRSSLEYAAQSGKKIIVSSHRSDVSKEVAEALDDYDVKLRFAATGKDCTANSDLAANSFYCLPYSEEKLGEKLFQLEMDSMNDSFKLSKVVVTGAKSEKDVARVTTKLLEDSFIAHNHLQEKLGNYGPRTWLFSLSNAGGYVIKDIKVSYDLPKKPNSFPASCQPISNDTDLPVKVECHSGKQAWNNIYTLVIPKEATSVSAQAFQLGDVNWVPIFNQNGKPNGEAGSDNLDKLGASFLLHSAYGAAGSARCYVDQYFINQKLDKVSDPGRKEYPC